MRRCPWGAAVSLCVYNAFWYHFPYFLHHFFGHRFCIDFVSTFHAFLSAQNHVFYCKTNSFEHFSLFQKSMKFHRFWHPFWHIFCMLLALIFDTFSTSIFACLFSCLFYDFWSKMAPKSDDRGVWQAPPGATPKTIQKPYLDFNRFWIDFGHRFGDILTILACFGASFFSIH